ncbi:MAG TPA: non-canonical purine NTP pyrophosphatase [Candidatus Dormibacteraeota bacterium]|nr:non-canonical purine NTP pyrophosphatase [Candidatus Dormibacteraeota bacterium]
MVVASRNPGKAAELRRLLRAMPWRLLELDQAPEGHLIEWVEDGTTYLENAAIKAQAVSAGTGLPALADDSGIEVPALGGWPGIKTARWMGEAATQSQLLQGLTERVASLPEDRRRAVFICALALAVPRAGAETWVKLTESRLEGVLVTEPRGRHGFGYDPIFIPNGEQRTMAEMSQSHKDEISHRGMAARELVAKLR